MAKKLWYFIILQNRKKSLYEAGWSVITKFLSQTSKGGAYVQYFLDIVLERDVRNQAGIWIFWIFG
jgi:hypothetical protein